MTKYSPTNTDVGAPSNPLPQSVLDTLSTAIILVDTQMQVRYLNASAQMLLEISAGRALQAPLAQLLPDNPQLHEELGTAMRDSSPHTNRGLHLKLASGHELNVDLMVTPFDDESGDYVGLLLELQVVDRLLRISREEGLLSSQQSSRAMIRGLAHEIKNPLGGVRGAAQLLARELEDPALEEYTQIIIAESDRLRDLVDTMLGPNQRPQPRMINVHAVLEHVRSLLEAEVGDSIIVTRDYDPSLPDICADRAQLVQALLNIVRNAMQATAANAGPRRINLSTRIQRQFTIGTKRHRLVCRVDIEDNGPGIPEELENSIFVPMVSGKSDGTGLGLSISQSIINQHDGIIECQTEPGRTIFSIYIPLGNKHADE
ncbi:PAS domain-containing protein [Halieaceae bacterium IMCC14734]|uniref:histidine kinase n=1 Tax=Candidatus Litorirhabdus singularis TaxID=2518993 RepID=A0ABT3TEI9_9GAMM|nr:nitrogen regulation protein NR(II) [Candidatus Litorirhabdus singularis]MCX2979829.1 PAS domain-containing protein [Candidatus Litorirhabdus singularis]